MRTPREIYAQYKIMPNLQLHQLRVAAVGKLICDNFKQPINKDDVILACLFHDMGNILKFDLSKFPTSIQPEGLTYWEAIKSDFQKYGPEPHAATAAIAQEINLSPSVLEILNATGYAKVAHVAVSASMGAKVLQYADFRVGPEGMLSLEERMLDLAQRYKGKKDSTYEATLQAVQTIENQIFTHTTIRPEDITAAAAAPLIGELWDYALA